MSDSLREALEKIRRTPSRPFPDAGAHSVRAWANAVWHAYCDIQRTAAAALSAPPDAAYTMDQIVSLTYTNYRGETAQRHIVPKSLRFGSTEWHPEPQWLLLAWDADKRADREFALKDFGSVAPQADAEPVAWRILCTDTSRGSTRYIYTERLPFEPDGKTKVRSESEPLYAAPPSQSAEMRELIDRYTVDIVKNAMLTMWNDICADTDCHPLDIEHGRGKRLTFTPQHWAEAAGKMVRQNILDLIRADDGKKSNPGGGA